MDTFLKRSARVTLESRSILNQLYDPTLFTILDSEDGFCLFHLMSYRVHFLQCFWAISTFFHFFTVFYRLSNFRVFAGSVAADSQGVVLYEGDIIVPIFIKLSHNEQFNALHDGFLPHNVATSPEECSCPTSQLTFLGYLVVTPRVRSESNRFSMLSHDRSPNSVAELCSLIESPQYYSRFNNDFSSRADSPFNRCRSTHYTRTNISYFVELSRHKRYLNAFPPNYKQP